VKFLVFAFFFSSTIGKKIFQVSKKIDVSSRAIASFVDIMKEKYYLEFNLVLIGDVKNYGILANKIRTRTNVPLNVIFDKKTA
jgi:hypothetical protein